MLLGYATTYPNALIKYHVINMVIHVDSNTEYLTISEAQIFYSRHFYLSDWPSPDPAKPSPKQNGSIHTE